MFSGQSSGVRNAGTNPDRGEPGKIVAVEDAQFKLVHYFDDRGRPVSEVIMVCGDRWFLPANSLDWAAKLRPVSTSFRVRVEGYSNKNKPPTLSGQDSVDVMPEPAHEHKAV